MRKIMKAISNILSKFLLGLVAFYRKFISPLKKPCCRFYPTCSCYAEQAIKKYGPVKGCGMAAYRILRCNPFCRGGYDPVK